MDRIAALRRELEKHQLDAALINSYENWRYFSGFTGSHAYLLITESEQILITDPRYTEQASQQAPGWRVVTHGLDSLVELKKTLEGCRAGVVGYETEQITDLEIRRLREALPKNHWTPMENVGKQIRAIKDEGELAALKQAIHIADQAVEEWTHTLAPGMSEREAAIELDYRFARLGSETPAFSTIIAAGERGALPHATPSDRIIASGEMVVVDCGAVYQGYHSDITRTIWVGEPELRMREIYAIVRASQEAALAIIRPGVKTGDVDRAHREIFWRYGLEQYSLRGLGHGVGLEIHEFPRVVMGGDDLIEPGMVFTVEPGIYIPGLGGVRIEDIVHVTGSGCEILTQCPERLSVPTGVQAIEVSR